MIFVIFLFSRAPGRPGVGTAAFALIGAVGSQIAMLTWFGAGLYYLWLSRPRAAPCEACRRIIPLEAQSGPAICPQCRVRHLRPDEVKREHQQSLRTGLAILVLLALLVAFLLPRGRGGQVLGMDPWIGVPLAALLWFGGILATMVGLLLAIQWRRRRRLRSERGQLAMARRTTGQEGEVFRDGAWTIWYSGWTDPSPMVLEQAAAGVRRLEDLTGGTAIAMPASRIVVFHDRGKFVAFHRQIVAGVDLAGLDGLHFGSPYHLVTLCTDPPPRRVANPERTMRMLAAHAGVEAVWGPRPPAWVQAGLARSAVSDEPGRLDRLNRGMAAALARRTPGPTTCSRPRWLT